LLLVLAIAVILGSEFRGTHNHILLPQVRDSHNLEYQVPVFISLLEQGGPVIPPGTGFQFRLLLRLAGLRWRYSNPSLHGPDTHRLISSLYSLGTDRIQNIASNSSSFVTSISVTMDTCLSNCYRAMTVFFRHYVTISTTDL
jgi:hypothetical protein